MSIAGAVLAAGRSERMGSPKALLDYRGKPFVVAILEALEALDFKHRAVVLGPDSARIRPLLAPYSCIIAENPEADSGPIGSLRTALAALAPVRPTALLVWPVDIPHVRIDTVERLVRTHAERRAPVIVPMFGSRRGHPVIWDNSLFDELATSSAATQQGARAVLRNHEAAIVTVTVDDPAVIEDIDTPRDYERLIREINRDAF